MKKTLFAVALLASSSAFAMDVSNPFYVPMKGDILSETSSVYVYDNLKDGNSESINFAEGLSYGITRNFSINATAADVWLLDTKGITGHDRYDNPAWGIGMKYNLVDCCKTNWKVQLGANYGQGGVDHHDKMISGYVKTGYQIKSFLPYVTLTGYKPVGKYEADPGFDIRMALNTAITKKVSFDFGGAYNYSTETRSYVNSNANTATFTPPPGTTAPVLNPPVAAPAASVSKGKHESSWTLDAALNYAFSDCMTVGVTGSYTLSKKPRAVVAGDKKAGGFTTGVNFKVAF